MEVDIDGIGHAPTDACVAAHLEPVFYRKIDCLRHIKPHVKALVICRGPRNNELALRVNGFHKAEAILDKDLGVHECGLMPDKLGTPIVTLGQPIVKELLETL